jgi:hypothetical protein
LRQSFVTIAKNFYAFFIWPIMAYSLEQPNREIQFF